MFGVSHSYERMRASPCTKHGKGRRSGLVGDGASWQLNIGYKWDLMSTKSKLYTWCILVHCSVFWRFLSSFDVLTHSLSRGQGSLPLRDLPEPPWSDVNAPSCECNDLRVWLCLWSLDGQDGQCWWHDDTQACNGLGFNMFLPQS